MTDPFSAYTVLSPGATLHAYLIESTAPDNIDDPIIDPASATPASTTRIPSFDQAIADIATALKNSENPTLIVSVHGFNSPRSVILNGYWNSFNAVNKDNAINNSDAVCIGYHWPSERRFAPICTSYQAAPSLLRGLLLVGIALSGIALFVHYIFNQHLYLTFGIGLFSVGLSFTLFLLRVVVYFQDGYRATSFGVPDLVEIFKRIDKELAPKGEYPGKRVKLSFIGHSMGAYVVTSVVRILSDVFDQGSGSPGPNATAEKLPPNIGHAFELARLILVSPDIPAEALISGRANFLQSSLQRFDEAYLFSNEGDEVLRLISTTANYFSFPTNSNKFGFRLGNISLFGISPGISTNFNLGYLQLGKNTFADLYNELASIGNSQLQTTFPQSFSYFDCTNCIENGKGVLTLANDPTKRIGPFGHFWLLILYLYNPQKYNVHGGYFQSNFLRQLIYRLACIGYKETEIAYGGHTQLSTECLKHEVRAILN
jgi:hypothetical protein